jgi:hypothetical protein
MTLVIDIRTSMQQRASELVVMLFVNDPKRQIGPIKPPSQSYRDADEENPE